MKLGATLIAALLCFVLGGAVLADTGTSSGSSGQEMGMGGHKVTLTGNVVDLSCSIASGAHGDMHKACAKACALNGSAFGIQTADGTIVTIFGKGPNDKPNDQIIPYVEEKVTVTGTEYQGSGVTGIRIDTISLAK